MSAIGRVFIVLNLILAGAFVGFAGTYLQKATDWKKAHDELQAKYGELEKSAREREESLAKEVNTAKRELERYRQQLEQTARENKTLQGENTRLNGQLAELGKDLKNLQSAHTTIAATIERVSADYKQAYELAMKASAERNEAVAARQKAEKELADASFNIKKLREEIGQLNGRIAQLTQENQEKEVLLALVRRKAPFVLETAQPDLQGAVQRVGPNGKLVTIEITANPANAPLKPGLQFAIYSGNTYKGEAIVTSIEGKFAFANVTTKKENVAIVPGDRAATNIGLGF